jgi:hypothetical protein
VLIVEVRASVGGLKGSKAGLRSCDAVCCAQVHLTREDFDILTCGGELLDHRGEFAHEQFQDMMLSELFRYSHREVRLPSCTAGCHRLLLTLNPSQCLALTTSLLLAAPVSLASCRTPALPRSVYLTAPGPAGRCATFFTTQRARSSERRC